MKKELKALLTALLATSCCTSVLAFTGCGGDDEGGSEPPPPPVCTEHVDSDGDGNCDNCNTTMPDDGHGKDDENENKDEDEYVISVDGLSSVDLDIGASVDLKWDVYKNGIKMPNGADVTVSVNNGNVTYDKATGKMTAASKGSAVATITLNSDTTVKATVRYTVHDYFFNHTLDRGEWSSAFEDAESNPHITINGGQAAVLVKEAATKFVFKYTLDMAATDIPTNQSFGIASFLPKSGASVGDNALWFGVRGTNTRGVFGAFVKQFYEGWGSGDEYIQSGYAAMETGFSDVEFVIIRNGLDYYYSINGFYEKYTVKDAEHAEVPTYAGIYSQTVGFDVSKYTYSSDQADVDAAIKEYYTDSGIAAVDINESYKTELVKGMTETYTAAAYPANKASGVELEWTLDKSEMTAGADGAAINVSDGVATLTLPDPAEGVVYVVCSARVGEKTVSKRMRVEILQRDLMDSNAHITVHGGVELNNKDGDDWSITFPESRMWQNGISINGSGNEDKYQQTKYCAVLNNAYSKDYSLEFKFSQYKNNKSTPKLQISLGADKSNFYLVYNAGSFRVESYTQGTQSNGYTTTGWHNTEWISDFDATAEHTFKLTVSDRGVYSLFIDGRQYGFFAVDGNQQLANPTTIVRKYADYDRALPIKFATDGCSVKVSDIKVTDGTSESSAHKFWSEHQSYTFDGENGFKMVVPIITDPAADGWQYGNWSDYKLYYTQQLDDGGYAIDMDVAFGALMTDSKLVMRVGNNGTGSYELQFCNKSDGLMLAYKKDNSWSGSIERAIKPNASDPLKIKVRVEVRDNNIRVIANGNTIINTAYDTSKISSNSNVEFYMFNKTQGDVWNTANPNKYAEISGFAVTGRGFAVADVYELANVGKDNNIDIYYSMDNTPQTVPVRILHNGAPTEQGEGYSITYKLTSDDKAYFEFDAVNGTVCGKDVPLGSVVEGVITASLKNSDGDIIDTLDYRVAAYNKSTYNNFVSVKGGVILDSQSDTDENYSLTFPMSKINVNGVGAESKYEANDYSADLKTTVKGDFSVEFTVSDYVTNTTFPKLMISLGGELNQFYVVYNREGTINHVETFVNASSEGGHGASGWISSDVFKNADDSAFNTSASHTFKIEVRDGIYHVYLDGRELRFSFDSDGDHATATLYRNVRDYENSRPVRIATNGVSAKVTNIKITDLNDGAVDLPDFYSPNKAYTGMTDTGFTMALTAASVKDNTSHNDAWAVRYSMYHKMTYLQPINTDTQIEFDVEFGGDMKDGKLVMKTGAWEYHFMNKLGGGVGYQFQLYPNAWGEPSTNIPNGKLHVVFERKDGAVWLYVNGMRILNGKTGADVSSALEFYIFGGADDLGKTATVSNFTERQYSDATRYEYWQIAAQKSDIAIKPNNPATAIGYTVTKNDAVVESLPGNVTVEYAITNSDYIKLDENHKVYATGEFTQAQTATVTVTLKVDGKTVSTVDIGITATAKETQNSTLSVSGGAILNYTDTPDEDGWSVTFPESKQSTSGIGSEFKYAETDYMAKFKDTVKGDFSLEFTVSNYKTNGTQYPKLMLSLGGASNQFYIAYNREGTINWVESWTRAIRGSDRAEDISWNNSEQFGNFDTTASHTFKFEVVNGFYNVYLDNVKLNFSNELIRGNYGEDSQIAFATNGVSVDISNIKLTKGSVTVQTYKNTDNVTVNADGGFTMKFGSGSWNAANFTADGNKILYFNGPTSSQTMEFDLDFSAKMSDSKFGITFYHGEDRQKFYIENKLSSGTIKLCCPANWGDAAELSLSELTTLHVKLERNNENVTITISANGNSASKTWGNIDAQASTISFWGFNENSGEGDITATVSNITIVNN